MKNKKVTPKKLMYPKAVMLDDETVKKATLIGKGNLSLGLRKAVQNHPSYDYMRPDFKGD
jgi:hypothetical protein